MVLVIGNCIQEHWSQLALCSTDVVKLNFPSLECVVPAFYVDGSSNKDVLKTMDFETGRILE